MKFNEFSWQASDLTAGARNVTYTFQYKIEVANPFFIFYALASDKAIDTSAIGNPFDLTKVTVLLDGGEVDIDNSGKGSFNYNCGICIKLTDQFVGAGTQVTVKLEGVSNKRRPGEYSWKWITTADHDGVPLQEATNGNKVLHLQAPSTHGA